MPINEIETHPYLTQGKTPNAKRLILGSFPVYECTDPDNEIKERKRIDEGTFRFFYGSIDSKFWKLYSNYVDNNIQIPPEPNSILSSLSNKQIAITDIIASCQRHDFSSEDSKLFQKEWNKEVIIDIILNGAYKILCTSKGVLSDLEKKVILPYRNSSVNHQQTALFQAHFIEGLGGQLNFITNPIAKVFHINNRTVQAIAIPSPGSVQRQLKRFGFNGTSWELYANQYFLNAFAWLME